MSLRTIDDCAVTVPVTIKLLEVLNVAQVEPLVSIVTLELLATETFEFPLLIAEESTFKVAH